ESATMTRALAADSSDTTSGAATIRSPSSYFLAAILQDSPELAGGQRTRDRRRLPSVIRNSSPPRETTWPWAPASAWPAPQGGAPVGQPSVLGLERHPREQAVRQGQDQTIRSQGGRARQRCR